MTMLKADELTAAAAALRTTTTLPAHVADPLATMLEVIASRWIIDHDVRHYPARQQFQEAALAIAKAVNG